MKLIPKYQNAPGPLTPSWQAQWVTEAKEREKHEDQEYQQFISSPYYKIHQKPTKQQWRQIKQKLQNRGTIKEAEKVSAPVRAINNYVREYKYDMSQGNVPKGKHSLPLLGLAATGIGSFLSAPITTTAAMAGGWAGGKALDSGMKLATGKSWAENMYDWIGLDKEPAEVTNPVMWVGGGLGSKVGQPFDLFGKGLIKSRLSGNTWSNASIDGLANTNQGKRAVEVIMRSRYDTHQTANPIPDLLQGWMTAPWNRRGSVLDYIITGGRFSRTGNKPFGYKESLAPFKQKGELAGDKEIYSPLLDEFKYSSWKDKIKMLAKTHKVPTNKQYNWGTTYNWGKYNGEPEVAYTGGFWSTHMPRTKRYGDAVDAYLYGTEIDPAYGVRRISIGKPEDFGMHREHIAENFPERANKIQVYEAEPNPNDDIVTQSVKSNGYYSSADGNIVTPKSNYDAGGHWRESGLILDSKGNPMMETRYQIFDKNTGLARTGPVLEKQLPKDFRTNPNITFQKIVQPKTAYRSQDIWKYNGDYMKKWKPYSTFTDDITLGELGKFGNLGVRLVDKAGTPILMRTPWRTEATQSAFKVF